MNIICNYFLKKSLIRPDEINIFMYGMKVFLLNFLTIISTIVAAFFIRNIAFGIYFLMSFIPIRMITGGYHCKTASNCFITYNIIICFLFSQNFENINIYHCIILLIFLLIIPCYVSTEKSYLNKTVFWHKKGLILLVNFIFLIAFKDVLLTPIFVSLFFNIYLLIFANASNIYLRIIKKH